MPKRRICALIKTVDTHTLEVLWDGQPRQIRLLDVNPESAFESFGRSPTEFGRHIHSWLCDEILRGVREVEFETLHERLISNSGKPLGHIFVRGENLAVRMVRQGYSPCFEKYGYPDAYASELAEAERWAIRGGLGIWGSPTAEHYLESKRWWLLRAGQVERCRHAMSMGEDILDARLNHDDIVKRASAKAEAVVFADAMNLYVLADGASLLQLANPTRPLCAYFPPSMRTFANHILFHHVGHGKPNYLFFNAPLSLEGEQPQIVVDLPNLVSTCPPKSPQ